MYDARQFRSALYILVMLGISGYCLATESPLLWVLAISAILFNIWLINTRRFVPIPRGWSAFITLSLLALFAFIAYTGEILFIITISQFVVVLQIIKLYEQRENRDYAQIITLSLLLMVAAAISTASLLFGVTFLLYLLVALYCSLLYHLKAETDRARAKYGQPAHKINPATLRQDQRYLPRSMRRLTFLVSTVAIICGIFVFLFFPRSVTEGMFAPMQLRTIQPLTGFNDRVSFQKVAQIAQNDDIVARVEAYYKDQKVTVPFPLLLRGSALDSYSGSDARRGMYQWSRASWFSRDDQDDWTLDGNEICRIWFGPDRNYEGDYSTDYRLVVNLDPTGTNKIFTMAGLFSMQPTHPMHLHFFRHDGVLESVNPLNQPIQYTIICSNRMMAIDSPYRQYSQFLSSVIDPKITQMARDPKVCGKDATGKSLAEYPLANDHSNDSIIANNIQTYLRNNYQYTLDLTNESTWGQRDPLVGFLYDFKKGHCEYFAGAMTLMCQSLGIPARMIVGFRCDGEDFNTLGDYYEVKQSDAHAWCEVFTGTEWQPFDPTTSLVAGGGSKRSESYFSKWMKVFDYFEYKWASSVIAYSRNDSKTLTEAANLRLTQTAVASSQRVGSWARQLHDWWASVQFSVSSIILTVTITLIVLVLMAVIVWFIFERARLRRRAKRIGLERSRTKISLLRCLEFYDDLIRALERHDIVRAKHLTPLEFSRSLFFLPNAMYNDIRRLTELFYRVRYGDVALSTERQKRLVTVVHRIQQDLSLLNLSFQ